MLENQETRGRPPSQTNREAQDMPQDPQTSQSRTGIKSDYGATRKPKEPSNANPVGQGHATAGEGDKTRKIGSTNTSAFFDSGAQRAISCSAWIFSLVVLHSLIKLACMIYG